MGFEVEAPNVGPSDVPMTSVLRVLRRRNFAEFNIIALFILTEGVQGHQVKVPPSSEVYELGEFTEPLSLNPSLEGCPKLLFVEWRNWINRKEPQSELPGTLEPDFFIGTSASRFSKETNKSESTFICQLLKNLTEHGGTKSLTEIFQRVQHRLSLSVVNEGLSRDWIIKTPEMRSSLWKELYLPGLGKLIYVARVLFWPSPDPRMNGWQLGISCENNHYQNTPSRLKAVCFFIKYFYPCKPALGHLSFLALFVYPSLGRSVACWTFAKS